MQGACQPPCRSQAPESCMRSGQRMMLTSASDSLEGGAGAPVVSSQGLTSMMMRDLVSLAFSAPRFLAAAMTASFSSLAFFSSCTADVMRSQGYRPGTQCSWGETGHGITCQLHGLLLPLMLPLILLRAVKIV